MNKQKQEEKFDSIAATIYSLRECLDSIQESQRVFGEVLVEYQTKKNNQIKSKECFH